MDDLRAIGGYAEVSPSGTGVKVLALGRKPGTRCSTKKGTSWGGEFAIYSGLRFFALTGGVLEGFEDVGGDQDAIDRIYRKRFPEQTQEMHTGCARGGGNGIREDELIKIGCRMKGGGLLKRLHFTGDASGYDSRSEADMAELRWLCFLTGGDEDRMVSAFMGSRLYLHAKGEGYVRRSARKAISTHRGGFYEPKRGRVEESRNEALEAMLAVLFAEEWKGQSGGTDHDVFCAVALGIEEEGRPYGDGMIWTPGEEQGARRAGVTRPTYRASLRRLAERFEWFRIVAKRSERSRGGVLLELTQLLTTEKCTQARAILSCKKLCQLAELLRLRWGRDLHARFQRVGKCAASYLHWLVAHPEGLTSASLSEVTGRRKNSVVSYLKRLASNGLVEDRDGVWVLHAQFQSRLSEVIEDNAVGAEERAKQQDERAEAARGHWKEREESGEDAGWVPIDLDAERLYRAGWRARMEDGKQTWARPGYPIEWVSREQALLRFHHGEHRPWSVATGLGPPDDHPLVCECLDCSVTAARYAVVE